jgi:hypothetical protein
MLAVMGVFALRDLTRLGEALPWRTMADFPVFYCAGSAAATHANPYAYEPLHACEHRANPGETFRAELFSANPTLVVPAPQPPYDFLPLIALARLPLSVAKSLDAVAIVVAVALTAFALAALGVPLEVAAAALLLSVGFESLNTGQIVPFALLALAGCGFALARGRDALAGLCAALTAIEPTAGLPVILAMLLFVPRARIAVVAMLAVFGICSLAVVGSGGIFAYFTSVLPAHAASEIRFPFQYSSTYALASLGLSPEAARLGGAISYAVLLVAGLRLAPRAGAALARRELLAFVPALCAVIGGMFLHAEELCFALPALCIFAVATRGRTQVLAALALCALSVPWILVWGIKQLFLASLFVCAVILLRLRLDLRIVAGAIAAIAIAIYVFELHPPSLPVPAPGALRVYAANELAQAAWTDYTTARGTSDPLWIAIKAPSWFALLAGLALAFGRGSRSRTASESNRGS